MDEDTLKCLHCGEIISHPDGDITAKCDTCGFHNVILKKGDFEDFIELNDFDPIFAHKNKLESGFMHYAWPSLTKGEFKIFQKNSPGRAEALLKKLKGEELSEVEDSIFRNMKSELKDNQSALRERIQYIKTKLRILDLVGR